MYVALLLLSIAVQCGGDGGLRFPDPAAILSDSDPVASVPRGFRRPPRRQQPYRYSYNDFLQSVLEPFFRPESGSPVLPFGAYAGDPYFFPSHPNDHFTPHYQQQYPHQPPPQHHRPIHHRPPLRAPHHVTFPADDSVRPPPPPQSRPSTSLPFRPNQKEPGYSYSILPQKKIMKILYRCGAL